MINKVIKFYFNIDKIIKNNRIDDKLRKNNKIIKFHFNIAIYLRCVVA